MTVGFDFPLDIMYNPLKRILNEKLSGVNWLVDMPVGVFLIWLINFGQLTLNMPTPFHGLDLELHEGSWGKWSIIMHYVIALYS